MIHRRASSTLASLALTVAIAAVPAAAAELYPEATRSLAAKQRMPRSALIRRSTCVARVRVAVDGNGLITDYAIRSPCNDAILTRATDDLLFKAGQLPPPPGRRAGSFEIKVRWPPRG
jgi:outer membrane biosynthesis protein TonB